MSDDDCAKAAQFRRVHAAFVTGDLDALAAAVEDPALIPNGRLLDDIGVCLVYAIYHSPLTFIRTLLELGADPNVPADDGFPPLIAALSSGQEAPGAKTRTDVDDVLRLLLSFGADPNNQRGINDYTPLHMAVAVRNALAVQRLLDAGADPELRTRIDDCETPLKSARAAGLDSIAALLERKGSPLEQRMRSGLTLLTDIPGAGDVVRRQHNYAITLRMWLNKGEPIRWRLAWGRADIARLEDDGATLRTEVRIDRRTLISGLFYGIEGMRVGGMRRLRIAPHLAYGDRGVPDVIPPNAVLTAEIMLLGESTGTTH